MDDTQKAIIKTICYADIFDFPLKKMELWQYVISNKKITKQQINTSLKRLITTNNIEQTQSYFHIPKRNKLANIRKKRSLYSQNKINKSLQFIQKLKDIVHIKAIFLSGAASMNNASQNDDIDICIITSANKLWSTRLKVLVALEKMKVRRRPNSKSTKDLICANMFLDELALKVPISKQNMYTAHEVAQVVPLFSRDHTYENFLYANQWITSYMANINMPNHHTPPPYSDKPLLFEELAYKAQKIYMSNKRTREVISFHTALFHPKNTDKKIRTQYQLRVNQRIKL